MASASVQVNEESLIRAIVAKMTLPTGVRLKRVDQDEDSTGQPALRIYFAVSKPFPLTSKRLTLLLSFKDALQEKIFAEKLAKWPFVHFVEAKQ